MTSIKLGSTLTREIRIPDVDKPVNVQVTHSGLYFWVKGSRKKVWVPWSDVVKAGTTPADIPSYLMGRPLELLRFQAAKTKELPR